MTSLLLPNALAPSSSRRSGSTGLSQNAQSHLTPRQHTRLERVLKPVGDLLLAKRVVVVMHSRVLLKIVPKQAGEVNKGSVNTCLSTPTRSPTCLDNSLNTHHNSLLDAAGGKVSLGLHAPSTPLSAGSRQTGRRASERSGSRLEVTTWELLCNRNSGRDAAQHRPNYQAFEPSMAGLALSDREDPAGDNLRALLGAQGGASVPG